jgi:hypothetical protein
MSQNAPPRTASDTIERRTFLRGAAAGLAATSGLEAILASRRAPAFAQGAEVHLLQWVDFIPEGDAEALTKYVITDMYAKAVQGTSPTDCVKWAEGELKKIYET